MEFDWTKFVVFPKPKELSVKDLLELEQYDINIKPKRSWLREIYKELDLD